MASLDLLIMQNLPVVGSLEPSMIDLAFGQVGLSVTGVQKAVQQWLTQLLTERGTVFSDPTFGTPFLTQLRFANLGDNDRIRGIFAESVKNIGEWNNANLDVRNIPSDELITTAELLELAKLDGTLIMQIRLLTADGVNRDYTVPLAVGAPK